MTVSLQVRAQAELERRRRAKIIAPDKTKYQDKSTFASDRLRILDKHKQLVPLTYNAIQRQLMDNLTGRDLVLKARQVGISTAIQGWLYQEVVTGTATTMTLAHDDDGTTKLRRIADRFYRNDPKQPKRGAANARLSTYPDHDSEAMIATAGNTTSGRAATLTHLHGSEVAFWKDAESIVAGAIQAGNPSVVLESTPNGAQGYFYNLCMEALDGNSIWHLHFYPWWIEPGYAIPLAEGESITFTAEEQHLSTVHNLTLAQIKWRRSKQAELKHLFAQEYPEDPRACFLLSGLGYFGNVSTAFSAPLAPIYDPSHIYVAGLDFGQTVDYTALCIIDSTIRHEVAWLWLNRLEWREMRLRVAELCKQWNVQTLVAEQNSMGTTNIEELHRELRAVGARTMLLPFLTTNESKSSLASALHETLSQPDGLKMQDDPIRRRELTAFQAVQLPSGAWKLTAPGGEHDDTVIARMLAYYGLTNQQRRYGGIFV